MITPLLLWLVLQANGLLATDVATGVLRVGEEVVVVTAERGGPTSATPVAVSVVTAADLAAAPQAALDEVLRGTPGFSLLRASSSRVANPTAQGVTLRGLGGSGASRALVLVDGVPLNDAFGGWVTWTRVPATLPARVDVQRGGASELYGSGALSGVVRVVSTEPVPPVLRVLADAGTGPRGRVSATGGFRAGSASVLLAAEGVADDGAYVVPEGVRGSVDEPAGADHTTILARVDAGGGALRGSARATLFGEDRRNGTPLQVNDTNVRQVIGIAGGTAGHGWWQARGAWTGQTYDQAFSSVAAGRRAETLTRTQRVPAEQWHGSIEWNALAGPATWLAGADVSRADGTTSEIPYVGGRPGATVTAGGRTRSAGAFAHVRVRFRELSASLGARAERWDVRDLSTGEDRTTDAFVPRGAIAWTVGAWQLGMAANAAFRAPTLNELFRGFRVGDTITRANPDLQPERERGVDATLLRTGRRGSLRATAFWATLRDPIANVTVSETAALIVRERRNAGRLRSRGFEAEGEWRLHRAVRLTGTAALTDAVYAEGPEPQLEGKRVPQVPEYQFGAAVHATPLRGAGLTFDLRHVGQRYEDDRNTLPLGAFTTVDALATYAFARGLQAFAAVENLLDEEYVTGRTPLPTIGVSRALRAGVRWTLP